jgi:hypothetical protein
VNFNGTGTVAIRASGNVSSITDNGVGDYTVNFSTAMPDASFAANLTCKLAVTIPLIISQATSQVRVSCRGTGAQFFDDDVFCVSVFR